MRLTTSVGICCQQVREEGGERVWLCEGCVAQPIREMKFAVVLYSGMCGQHGHEGCVLIVGWVAGFR